MCVYLSPGERLSDSELYQAEGAPAARALLCPFSAVEMRVSVLGCVLLLVGIRWEAAATVGDLSPVTEPKAGVVEMKGQPFVDVPTSWRVKRDTYTADDTFYGAMNTFAYSQSEPEIIRVAPEIKHYESAAPVEIEVMHFKTYEEITMLELVDLEPNSTRNRCLDCCRPTTFDPERPIMRKEEGDWSGDKLEQNRAAATGTETESPMGRCSQCCILKVDQIVERLKNPWYEEEW